MKLVVAREIAVQCNTSKQTNKQTNKQTDRQTDRQTNKQKIDKQIDQRCAKNWRSTLSRVISLTTKS